MEAFTLALLTLAVLFITASLVILFYFAHLGWKASVQAGIDERTDYINKINKAASGVVSNFYDWESDPEILSELIISEISENKGELIIDSNGDLRYVLFNDVGDTIADEPF